MINDIHKKGSHFFKNNIIHLYYYDSTEEHFGQIFESIIHNDARIQSCKKYVFSHP